MKSFQCCKYNQSVVLCCSNLPRPSESKTKSRLNGLPSAGGGGGNNEGQSKNSQVGIVRKGREGGRCRGVESFHILIRARIYLEMLISTSDITYTDNALVTISTVVEIIYFRLHFVVQRKIKYLRYWQIRSASALYYEVNEYLEILYLSWIFPRRGITKETVQ